MQLDLHKTTACRQTYAIPLVQTSLLHTPPAPFPTPAHQSRTRLECTDPNFVYLQIQGTAPTNALTVETSSRAGPFFPPLSPLQSKNATLTDILRGV